MNDTLYIPIPTGFFGYRLGVNSTRHPSAERIIMRITKADREILKRGAKVLDMREAQFLREIGLTAAKALIQREQEMKEKEKEHAKPGDGVG